VKRTIPTLIGGALVLAALAGNELAALRIRSFDRRQRIARAGQTLITRTGKEEL